MSFSSWITQLFNAPKKIKTPRYMPLSLQSLEDRVTPAVPFSPSFPTAISIVTNTGSSGAPASASAAFTVTFSDAVTGVDANDFSTVATGTVSGGFLTVSGSGKTYTVTANGVTGNGTLGLNLNGNASISATASFAPQSTFGVGVGGPYSVSVGDVNGDGNLDIVTVNRTSNSASVFLAIGGGSFAPQTTFAVGNSPISVTLGDVNKDRNLDIVTANSGSKNVSVLLGIGDGTFAPQQTFSVADDIFARPVVVTLGDVNNDSNLDIVTATNFFSTGAASVLLGNGNGTFGMATTFAANGSGISITSLTLGDVNNDSNLDIVTGISGGGTVSVLLGNGNGAFQAQNTFSVGNFEFPLSVSPVPTLGDVNNDNNLDIVTSNGNGSASVLLGNGNGTFGPATTFVLEKVGSLTLGDVNNDSKLDIVTANGSTFGSGSNTASVLLGNGNGAFGTPTTFAVGGNPGFVTLGKVNGDSNLDIVTANTISNTVSILVGDGKGSFANPTTFGPGVGGLSSLSWGDVNGDGKVDIVTANNGSNNASVFLGNGNGAFQAQATFAVGDRPNSVTLGDVNGDGRLDLVTSNIYSDNASVLLGNGNGTFAAQTSFAVGDSPGSVTLGDVNGDGRLDIVTTNGSVNGNTVSVLLGTGNGTFANRTTSAVGKYPGSLTLGDVNGDGKLDIVSTISYGASVLLGNGDGSFEAPVTLSTLGRCSSVALGDVNGDGKLDIAAGTDFGFSVSVFLGNGNGTFATPNNIAADFSPFSVKLGDVNGDGKLDIVTPGFFNTISVLLGNGNGTFATNVTFAAEGNIRDMTLSDVNSDGRLDIVTGNINNNTVSVLLGNNSSATSVQFAPPANFGPGTSAPSSMAMGDVSGDGELDIVTANGNSANVSVLLGDGKGGFGAQTTFAVGNSPSSVTLGDVNGDGKLDIVATGSGSGGGSASVLLNFGFGFFSNPTTFATGNFPASGTLGDVNGDKNLDIVTTSSFQGGTILLGDGKGAFAAPTTFDSGYRAYSVKLGDVNGDGNLDIVTANGGFSVGKTVSVLLGDGKGTFGPRTTFAVGDNPNSVTLGDVNGDKNLDIVTANYTSDNASVLLGDGKGSFGTQTTFAVGDNPNSVTLGDVNNDGMLDIVTANGDFFSGIGSASVLLGDGKGAFGPQTTLAVGNRPNSVSLGDVNGDNNLDIVTANRDNTESVLLGDGKGSFGPQTAFGLRVSGVGSVTMGDVNGDGKVDIVTANRESDTASVFLGLGSGAFGPQTTFATGRRPRSLALGDVNGDGKLDIVTANRYGYTVSVLLGLGNGAFGPQSAFPVDGRPASVTLGDVNGDGKLDIVTAGDGPNNVSVLLGKGDGTFGAQATFAAGTNFGSLQAGTLGDVNADGRLDIVTSSIGAASVLLGKGDGTFGPQTTFAVEFNSYSMKLGDVNGDGKLDLVTGNGIFGSSTFSVLLGNGDGTFAPQTTFAVEGNPQSLALGDVNGDGKLDIVTANSGFSGESTSVLLGNGNGTFAPPATFAVVGGPRSVALSDVNGDGRLDILTGNYSTNTVSVLLNSIPFTGQTFNITNIPPTITSENSATFTFGKAGSFNVTATGTPTPTITATVQFSPAENFGPGTSAPSSMAMGDVSGDGELDIVTANGSSANVSVLLGDGKGGFGAQTTFAVGNSPSSVTLGDVNGDGKLDIVATVSGSGGGSASVLLGDGKGGFGVQTTFASGNFPNSMALGDVNGDGNLDIVATSNFGSFNFGPTISVLLGDGKGSFAAPTTFAGTYGMGSLTLGDVNGDGNLDIVTANGGFTFGKGVSVLLGDGKGSFAAPTTFAVGDNPQSLALGDVNGDKNLDIVTANYTSDNASVLLGDGKGSFGPQSTFAVGDNPRAVKLGDVNGDSKLDIVTANGDFFSGIGSASVLLGDGKGAFGTQTTLTVGNGPVSVSLGDVNGDNNLDIVTANRDNTESVLLGDGKGSFGPQTPFGPGISGVGSATVGDFNGDKNLDIVTLNRQSGNASLFLGLGNGAFAEQTAFAVGILPGALSIGDVNRDGKLDLVITNSDINGGIPTASVFLGKGDGTFAPLAPFAAGSSLNLGDVNGDGKLDIVTVSGIGVDSTFNVLLGNGDGTFGAATTFASGITFGSPGLVTLGDVNGDGNLDIVSIDGLGGGGRVLLGDGKGAFGLPATFSANSFSNSLTLGDVNGDGKLDLVTGNGIFGGSNVNIFLGDGKGSFGDPAFVAVEGNPSSVTLGDVNGDGKLDIVTANNSYQSGSSSGVFLGNGNGTFAPPATFAVGGGPRSVALSDVDGDGKLDIVTGNYNNNTVSVLLGNKSSAPTGTLPEGLTLSSAGSITGTPTQGGTFNFTIIAANGVTPNATQSFTLTVTAAATTTGLTRSTNPSFIGESVSFTAEVAAIDPGAGIPSGTVTFFNGTTSLGSSTLNIGFAALSVDNLPLGTSSIKAVYNGNDNFLTSASIPLDQTVTKATSAITLTSSVNPSALGQSTTLTATVTSSCTCVAGTPTGLVIFKNGADTLGSVTLNGSGVASLSLTTLPVGNLTISGEYSGDSNFDSNTVFATQSVAPFGAATALSLTTSASDAVAGKAFGVQPVVTIKDAFGNTVTNSTAAVTMSASSGATVVGTATINAVNGVATFTNVGLDGNVGNYTLTYSSGTLTQGQSINLGSGTSPVVVGTTGGSSQGSTVTIVDQNTGEVINTVIPFPNFQGEVRVAAGDLDGDGKMETIAAAGPGGGPAINILDSNGNSTGAFFAYDPAFTGGCFITVSDVNNDGFADIITGAGAGGGPHVKIFSGKDLSVMGSFFAFDEDFSGGVSVASADINGDGFLDVVTGAGPGGGPHVKVFDGKTNSLISQWFAYASDFTGGVFVAIGDIGNDGKFEVVTGAGVGGGPVVAVFDTSGALQTQFFAYGESFTGGVRVGVSDGNGDGVADLVTGAGPGGGPHVKGFNYPQLDLLFEFFSGPADDTGGVFVN